MAQELENEIVTAGDQRFPTMKNQVLANVLWCMATIQHYSLGILDCFTAEVTRRLHHMDVREVSVVMWAFAKLGYHPGQELLEAFDQYALKNVSSPNTFTTVSRRGENGRAVWFVPLL